MNIGSRVRAAIVTTERWLCAPYSEISFDDGHSEVTGTATRDRLRIAARDRARLTSLAW